MGSDESHFNVSVESDGQRHKTVSTNHNLFEEKGEPKRYRTEVLSLTSLTPYRWAKPTHILQHLLNELLFCARVFPTRLQVFCPTGTASWTLRPLRTEDAVS